jgi:hypothetical protein
MNVQAINPPLLNPFGLNKVSGAGYSPFGGPVPLGGFGAPYVIAIKPPPGLFAKPDSDSSGSSKTGAPPPPSFASFGPPPGMPSAVQPFATPPLPLSGPAYLI